MNRVNEDKCQDSASRTEVLSQRDGSASGCDHLTGGCKDLCGRRAKLFRSCSMFIHQVVKAQNANPALALMTSQWHIASQTVLESQRVTSGTHESHSEKHQSRKKDIVQS